MKTALLTALVLGLSVAGFAQGPQPDQGAPKGKPQRAPGMHRPGMQRPGMGMRGGNRGEMAAKIEFPQEWAALERQRADLIAKAREKSKLFREAVKNYRANKDEASLKLIKESLGKRYDYFAALAKKHAEKQAKDPNPGPMAEKLKKRFDEMLAEGKDKWVEKQIQRILTPRKRGPRGGKAPVAEKKAAEKKAPEKK